MPRLKPPLLSSCLVLAGAALVALGVGWIYPPAGVIVAGIGLILIGWPA